MLSFKASVSKNQKRFNIIIKANSQDEARTTLHKEGYSILSIELAGDIKTTGKKYYFTIKTDSGEKNGTIVGEDLLKVYIKLRQDLGYKVKYLYSDPDISEEEKINEIHLLEENYKTYLSDKSNKEEKKVEKQKKDDEFYLKEKVSESQKILSMVMDKIKKVQNGEILQNIDIDKKTKLIDIYNALVKLQKSTNINKINEVSILALEKIGKLELEDIEKNKNLDSRNVLDDTNKLLKKLGSKSKYIEKDKDYIYQIKKFFAEIKEKSEERKEFKKANEKKPLDKNTISYTNTKTLLNKYREKLKDNNREKFNNIFCFIFPFGKNIETRDNIKLREDVIRQNILLLQSKLDGTIPSYVRIKKGYNLVIEKLILFLEILILPIKIIIFLYILLFILYFFTIYFFGINVNLNYNGILFFILLLITYFLIRFSKGLFSLIFNFAIFSIIFIFGVINF